MNNKKARHLIIIMTMISIIFNMAHPVTPELIDYIGGGSSLFGIVFAVMAFTMFITSPIWGNLSDQHGRKLFMLIAPVGYAFAQLGFGFSQGSGTIILFRILSGAMASAVFVSGMAYLVDVTNAKERSKYMGFYTALTGFGATIGYLLGGYIGNENFKTTFIIQAIFSLLSSVVILIFLKEAKNNKGTAIKLNLIRDFKKYSGTVLPFLLLMIVLTSFMFKGFDIAINSYMKYGLDFKPFEIGIVMAISGGIGLFTNFVIFPILRKTYNDLKLLIFSIIMMTSSLALATIVNDFNIKISILAIFFAFLAMYRPLIQSIVSKVGEKNGEIMGLNNAANSVGMVIGSLYIGYIFEVNINLSFYSIVIVGMIVFISLILKSKSLEHYAN